jgi:anti-sigma factor RsiW
MLKHFSENDILNYLERKLPPEDLLSADDHLAQCDLCFEKITAHKSVRFTAINFQNAFLNDLKDDHLTYEQLAFFVDGAANEIEKEIVEVHREICRECAGQIEDLRQMRAMIAAETKQQPVPDKFSFTRWWQQLWANSAFKIAVPAMALVLFAALIGLVLISRQSPQNEVAEIRDPESNNQTIAPATDINQLPDSPQPQNTAGENTNSNIQEETNTSPVESRIIASLNDAGSRIELDESGNVKGLDAPQYEKKIKAALETQNIEIASAPKELKSGRGVLMGGAEDGVPFAIIKSNRKHHPIRPPDLPLADAQRCGIIRCRSLRREFQQSRFEPADTENRMDK